MRLALFLALSALVLTGFAARADLPAYRSAEEIIDRGRDTCERADGGTFTLIDGAITETDLDGDGVSDKVVEEAKFSCSTMASLYCGTGGCMTHLVVGDQVYSRLAKGWKAVEWAGDTIILLALHGSECGGTNLRRCYEAIAWSEGGFKSVRTPPDGGR
jgi:hypothetical protein